MTSEPNYPSFDDEFEPGQRLLDERVGRAEAELKKLDAGEPFERGAIDEVWRDLAAGKIDVHSAALWAETIASRITARLLKPKAKWTKEERYQMVLLAIGVVGMPSKNYVIARDLQLYLDFEDLFQRKPKRNRLREMADFLTKKGHYMDLAAKPIENRIRRALKKIKKTP